MPLRILHLEDSPLDVELVAIALANDGLEPEVSVAQTESEFLRGLEEAPDLILADYSLPEYDGALAVEAARRICPEAPFIYVSGTLGEETAVEAMKRGATDYVIKTRLDRLGQTVRRALNEAGETVQRKKAEQELTESREVLGMALEAARMGLWDWNLLTGEVVWSDRCKALFGVPLGEAVSLLRFFAAVHPEDRSAVKARIDEAQWERKDYNAEFRVVWPDGSLHWISAAGHAFYDEADSPVRMSGVAMDITERKQTEEELREASQRKSEFLAMLSHELRNPLAAIRYALQEMRERGNSPESALWTRDVIDRQSEHLAKLVDELLDVTRISRGRIQLHREVLDLADIFDNSVSAVRSVIAERRHELSVEYESGAMLVNGDSTRMEQVVVNLLSNAAKYTEPGGKIFLKATVDGGQAAITVQDTGIGISAEELPRIFDVFAQGHRSIARSEGGIGLGLSIVRGLVEMHGGTIAAFSEGPGRGSRFVVRLPIAGGAVVAAPPRAVPTAAPASAAPRHRRVLVVDDNLDSLQGLTRLLKLWGYQVREVEDGLAALKIAGEFCPEIVLLDIGLPGMDGYTLAERLRAGVCVNSLLIAISGYGQEEDRRRSKEAGCDFHCVKPVGAETIKRLLTTPRSELAELSLGSVPCG